MWNFKFIYSWEFHSDDNDIKFGVIKKANDGTHKYIVHICKIIAPQLDEIGIVTIEVPGVCKCSKFCPFALFY